MTEPLVTPLPVFDHLLHLSDRRGTFEHALLTEPERSGGYRTDDMARLLVVATRQPDPDGAVKGLAGLAVRYLNEAQSYAGPCRNHMDDKGNWVDQPSLEVWWGRCLWALGTAAAHSSVGLVRRVAVIQFERAGKVRSPSPLAMAYAALGAADGRQRRRPCAGCLLDGAGFTVGGRRVGGDRCIVFQLPEGNH